MGEENLVKKRGILKQVDCFKDEQNAFLRLQDFFFLLNLGLNIKIMIII